MLVIYDDDGSWDGTTALLYLLSQPEISVQAIIISYGEAHPKVYIQYIGRMLDDFGIRDIPLGAGQDAPLANGTAFPDWLRQLSDNFWNVPLPNAGKTYPVQYAPELMVAHHQSGFRAGHHFSEWNFHQSGPSPAHRSGYPG